MFFEAPEFRNNTRMVSFNVEKPQCLIELSQFIPIIRPGYKYSNEYADPLHFYFLFTPKVLQQWLNYINDLLTILQVVCMKVVNLFDRVNCKNK